MREIHQGLPYRDFLRPATGLLDVTVCAKSGLLKTPSCPEGVSLTFLEGTQPMHFCEECGSTKGFEAFRYVELNPVFYDTFNFINDLRMPVLDEAFLREIEEDMRRSQASQTNNINTALSLDTTPALSPETDNPQPVPEDDDSDEEETIEIDEDLEPPSYNPLLD
jgi:penicillin-binding protein 1A